MKHWTRHMPTHSGFHMEEGERAEHEGLAAIAEKGGPLAQEAQQELHRRNKKRKTV